jgi:transcriptional regulator with XRE-family HTH domain
MTDLRERRLRVQADLSSIAVRAGVTAGTLSRAERGLRPLAPGTAARVEAALSDLERDREQRLDELLRAAERYAAVAGAAR